MSALLSAALDYASRGWPVFPIWWPVDGRKRCACAKPDCGTIDEAGELRGSPAKHPIPEHGLKDASTDPATIRAWWSRWPHANIGLRTGVAFDVLDLDSLPAGRALAVAADLAGEDTSECWGHGPMSITAHGQHLYFEPTGAGNTTGLIVAHVDWRGAGGYVVAAPSVHVSGHMYRWHDNCGPGTPLPLAPAFIVAALFKLTAPPATDARRPPISPSRPSTEHAIAGLAKRVRDAQPGQRNHMLNWAAHALSTKVRIREIDQSAGVAGCDRLLEAAVAAGLTAAEAEATIRSGWRAGLSGRAVNS